MKDINTQKEMRLEHFSSLFESARLAAGERDEIFARNKSQYLGTDEIDGGERALTVRNITYEMTESEVDSDIPVAKVDALSYSEERERRAAAIERLCSAIRDKLPFENLNDLDERYTYIYGASVWYVEWEQDDADGSVRVHCISPECFYGQPGVTEVADMEYCFLTFTTTKSELISEWGASEEECENEEYEYKSDSEGDTDTVTLVVCFYRDENGEIGRLVFSGSLLLSDTPNFYKRKATVCARCGAVMGECECDAGEILTDLESERIELDGRTALVPYYTPRRFPIVIRKNTRSGDSLYGMSDCDLIRPQQQAINKVESRILQKLLRAGITPIMPEDSTVTLGNSVFGQVIKMRPGESASSYGKIDTTPDISQDVLEADRLYEQARRILGISDALQGTDTSKVESGYARELKLAQSTSRLESKRRMKKLAYSEIYRLIFEHYLAFADESRELTYKDGLGRVQSSEFNRHSFIDEGGFYTDEFYFSVDEDGGTAYQREGLWERNLQNLESGTLGDKANPATLLRYLQAQERAHYPFARDNVEYFKSILGKQTESEIENDRNE